MTETSEQNKFLHGSLVAVFLKTAAPIILIMLVNGSFNLVDAYFLGVFVGADALTAVTSMFPAAMLVVALSTLVSNGFVSVMTRAWRPRQIGREGSIFAGHQSVIIGVRITCRAVRDVWKAGGITGER